MSTTAQMTMSHATYCVRPIPPPKSTTNVELNDSLNSSIGAEMSAKGSPVRWNSMNLSF